MIREGTVKSAIWVIPVIAMVFFNVTIAVGPAGAVQPDNGMRTRVTSSRLDTPVEDALTYQELYIVSEAAAYCIGRLALVEGGSRARVAQHVAKEVASLAEKAATLEEGGRLEDVLRQLSAALESYAAGRSGALVEIRTLSARNAQLRDHYQQMVERREE